MTKKELAQWLEEKKGTVLSEKQKELSEKKDRILETELRPLGFYQMADQVQSLIQQAWDLWCNWKKEQKSDSLSFKEYYYDSFDDKIQYIIENYFPLTSHIAATGINLKSVEEMVRQEREICRKIAQAYGAVIATVNKAKNGKEAETYIRGLGFDLIPLEKKSDKVDTTYLYLKKAA